VRKSYADAEKILPTRFSEPAVYGIMDTETAETFAPPIISQWNKLSRHFGKFFVFCTISQISEKDFGEFP